MSDLSGLFLAVEIFFIVALIASVFFAPKWIKEIGLMALVFAIFFSVQGFHIVFRIAEMNGEELTNTISHPVLYGGFKVIVLQLCWGLAVYFFSLILRIATKKRK